MPLRNVLVASLFVVTLLALWPVAADSPIPLAEHPRPDFLRAQWQNLNGSWQFRFDQQNVGEQEKWFAADVRFPQQITVPFSWGSELSGVADEGDIGWYRRTIRIPAAWRGQRVMLVVGASDWHTTAWLDGQQVGSHQGGYTPFALDLTEQTRWGEAQALVIRVDDTPHPFKLEGKQGYGRAAGIWQTVYLERRPQVALNTVHFIPDIDRQLVTVQLTLTQAAPQDMEMQLVFRPADRSTAVVKTKVEAGAKSVKFDVPLPQPRLWSLEDPYLYEVTARLVGDSQTDEVDTYFGMRKISVGQLPGTDLPYVLLNDRPIYLQMSLDQAYHPQGFYTFPSDTFMRDEILRARQIGLNGQRIHIKVEIPRKLYWADRLGMLIMADVPNSWGEPDERMQAETEFALRGMIQRDYNHPAIFSWVNFNETWGLKSGPDKRYAPETQEWVARIYRLTKQLDPTRLVEDNSPCNLDHVETDLNTWHAYLPGYAWREQLDQICRDTFPGSTWNFIGGRKQGSQPMMNSECGNVWGYEGSAGRRRLELGLSHHDERVPASSENVRLALHRTPRCDQRMERVLALRSLGESHRPGSTGAGNESARSARQLLCGFRARAVPNRQTGRGDYRTAVCVAADRRQSARAAATAAAPARLGQSGPRARVRPHLRLRALPAVVLRRAAGREIDDAQPKGTGRSGTDAD